MVAGVRVMVVVDEDIVGKDWGDGESCQVWGGLIAGCSYTVIRVEVLE